MTHYDPLVWGLGRSLLSHQPLLSSMRVNKLLGITALLIAASASLAPARASGFNPTSNPASNITILDADLIPSLNERLMEDMPPLPIANGMKLASSRGVSTGQASWYGPGFYGNRTANGEVFRPGTLTAAHRTLPFGTRVRVTNLWNGRSTVVRINDRGPFHGNRVIDLAHGAAQQLGLISSGVADVKIEVLR
jgi:rare lipoprotein A